MNGIKSIKEAGDLKGIKVLLRVDFNVAIEKTPEGDVVRDDYRLKRSIPTIKYLLLAGARVILISHIESNDTTLGDKASLKPVFEYIQKNFAKDIRQIYFFEDAISDAGKKAADILKDGEVVLFENIRRYEGEKNNDEKFAKELASLADIYVNDAFAVSHRSHASIVGVPKYLPHFAGLLLQEEIKALDPEQEIPRPFLFILGGAKFETKLPLITKYLEKADTVFVGGALANDLFKTKGYEVGASLLSKDETIEVSLRSIINDKKLVVPQDVWVMSGNHQEIKDSKTVLKSDSIKDAGSAAVNQLKDLINKSRYVLWNGPLGGYEQGYEYASLELAKLLGDSEARTVVGGGDTLAAIKKANVFEKLSFVSTGGGAMLEFLEKGTLVGVEALKN